MTTPTAVETPSQPAVPDWSRGARRFGWALLACWVLLIATAVFAGERSSSLADLERAVESGDVTVVGVEGGMSRSARGYALLELHWRDGPFAYYAEVREARPRRAAPHDGDLDVVRPGVVDRLAASHPDLRVERRSGSDPPISGSLAWWRLPWPLLWAGPLLLLATIGLLIAGPQPWRATRWAWFWLSGIASPIGVFAYLILGGPTSLSRPPLPGASRMTGGWAFLLSLLASSVIGSVAATVW